MQYLRFYTEKMFEVVITLAVSMKLMNILARFSIDFSVTIVAATHVLS